MLGCLQLTLHSWSWYGPLTPSHNDPRRKTLTLLLLNTTCPVLANSVDPDQLASEEANWSGSALFVIKYMNFYHKPGSSNLIGWKLGGCGILIYSAWQGLTLKFRSQKQQRILFLFVWVVGWCIFLLELSFINLINLCILHILQNFSMLVTEERLWCHPPH